MIISELFEGPQMCPECGGISFSDLILAEKKDACYYKVKASAKVWPSAYASGRLVQCRKKGAANYGNKSEGVAEGLLEMDKSQTPPGRDGSNDPDAGKKEYTAKIITPKKAAKDGEKILNKIFNKKKGVAEEWSQKYKSSINCSHPKGFSQKAHCAGKKKHNESVETEMVCEDCGMCETHQGHENLDEACWKGYHKEGNKKMFGKTYPNCVKNTKEDIDEDSRVARKPGQPADSKKHSDLYTDENPKGTITGLKFATEDDAKASVSKIRNSGRSHAHKIQAAVAMEQRAKAAGKAAAASVYRAYINSAKNKTNEQGVAEDNLNELDMFAPVTTYVRLANGTYVAANWRRNQNLSTASNSASFIDIKPLAPAAAKQLGLDQRLNDPEKKYTGATTIASGGPIQASGPLADRTINVVDIRDPKAAKDSGVPDTLFGKIAQWAQQQGQKQPGVAEGVMSGAEELNVGDPVVITGNVEFEGTTGEIAEFGRDKRFVVVDLYNHGQHSFHSSDVSFNKYAGSDDEEARMHDAGEFGDDPRDDMDEAKKQPPEAKYDDEYDAMVARVKKLAGLGPMKTVYDPARRQYRNMPTAVQPKK